MAVHTIGPKGVLRDLRRIARGKEPKAPAWIVAHMAVRYVEDGIERDDTEQLFRMFRLLDPRD